MKIKNNKQKNIIGIKINNYILNNIFYIKILNHHKSKLVCSSFSTLLNLILFYFNFKEKCKCNIKLSRGFCLITIYILCKCNKISFINIIFSFIKKNNKIFNIQNI